MNPSPSASWTLEQSVFVDPPPPAPTALEGLVQTHSSLAVAFMCLIVSWTIGSSSYTVLHMFTSSMTTIELLVITKISSTSPPYCTKYCTELHPFAPWQRIGQNIHFSGLVHNRRLNWLEESKSTQPRLNRRKGRLLHYEREGLVVCHHRHPTWAAL